MRLPSPSPSSSSSSRDDDERRWCSDAHGRIFLGPRPPSPSSSTRDDDRAPSRRRGRRGAGGGRIYFRGREDELNEHGHDYDRDDDDVGGGGSDGEGGSDADDGAIHDLLRTRMRCKLDRDFDRADAILDELESRGVRVDDKRRRWRRVTLNEFGHEYQQVGGPVDPTACTLTDRQIHAAIRERTERKRAREYREADRIERRLGRFGVRISDERREWRADGAPFVPTKMKLNRFGHNYARAGGPVNSRTCALRRDEIHALLRERLRCKLARDFATADTIQERLRGFGIDTDDKRREWRADGRTFERRARPRTPSPRTRGRR